MGFEMLSVEDVIVSEACLLLTHIRGSNVTCLYCILHHAILFDFYTNLCFPAASLPLATGLH